MRNRSRTSRSSGVDPRDEDELDVGETAEELALRVHVATVLRNETPRGRILVAAEYANSLLDRLLRAAMVSNTKADKLLGRDRPLGHFGMRILSAYAFGLLPEHMYVNLEHLRDIRNRCAHHIGEVTVEDEEVLAAFARLHVPHVQRRAVDLPAHLRSPENDQLSRLVFICGSLEGWVAAIIPMLEKRDPQRLVALVLPQSATETKPAKPPRTAQPKKSAKAPASS